jgi:hypothetical protein
MSLNWSSIAEIDGIFRHRFCKSKAPNANRRPEEVFIALAAAM